MKAVENFSEQLDHIVALLSDGERIDIRLSGGGRLYVDRPLPFLCVYRPPEDRDDEGTEWLITTQSAYLIAPRGRPSDVDRLLHAVSGAMSEQFGSFLFFEIWTPTAGGEADEDDPYSLQPEFRIVAPDREDLRDTVTELAQALQRVRIHQYDAEVSVSCPGVPAPPDRDPLFLGARASEDTPDRGTSNRGTIPPLAADPITIGIEVAPIYRNERTGEFYPFLFEVLRRRLGTAIKRGAHTFAGEFTSLAVPDYLALGRRAFERAISTIDEGLARIDESFDFLLQITPVNPEEAWMGFEESGFDEDPIFRYRPQPVDPELLKRRLFDLPIEDVEDPTLAWIFREKMEELDRKITMLRDRNSRQFFFESLQLYGEVSPELLGEARRLLEVLPRQDDDLDSIENLDAQAFAEIAASEFVHYRENCDEFPETVHIRRDMPPGLMVSRGRLLISHLTQIPAHRVDALLHHEVGTHMLTYYNGRAQPLRLLYNGMAGYEALQEGIAVLAESLAGGLNVARLRVLAARVVAAQCLIDGATFVDVFRRLRAEHGFDLRESFSIALRTFRGGGIIKDVIYLRGLHELMRYLHDGGDFDVLLDGKLALRHLPVLQELRMRGILRPAPLRPRYLLDEQALERLERVRRGATLLNMIQQPST